MSETLDELEALLAKATQGPLTLKRLPGDFLIISQQQGPFKDLVQWGQGQPELAELAVALVNSAPSLIAAARRAESQDERIARLEGALAEDETYEIGKRDGYAKAVQDIDILTGGDGEYCYVLGDESSERHCPDAETMKARIEARFDNFLVTLKFIGPALLVLRNMCARAKLSMGEAKAKEMIDAVRAALSPEGAT